MSSKCSMYTCSLLVIALISINVVSAGTIDNEIYDPEYYMLEGIKVYESDRQCALVGGFCVHTSDCSEPTTNKGLCPSNAHRGVECCYELPLKPLEPAPCAQHLGECMDKCNQQLMRPSTDCENGRVCCVLV